MKILIRSFVRQRMCLIKSVAVLYVGVIAVVLFMWRYLTGFLPVIREFSNYYELVIAFGLLFLLFRKTPMICIDEATLHYLDGTRKLKFIYVVKYISSFLSNVIGAAVITLVLYNPIDINVFMALALLMNLCNLLNWKSYHDAIPMGVSIIWYIFSVIPFLMSMHVVCIFESAMSVFILLLVKNNINTEKYRKYMKLCNKTMVANVLHDQVMLANLANEHMKERHFNFKIKDKMLKYPLITKGIVVDTLRRPMFYWIIKIVMFIAIIIIPNMIKKEMLSSIILVILLGNEMASFMRDSAYEANKLILKQKLGLAIPYSDWYVSLSYSIVPSVLCSITMVGVIVFCEINSMHCLCALVLNIFLNVLWHKMVVSYPNKRKYVDVIGYSLCLACLKLLVN